MTPSELRNTHLRGRWLLLARAAWLVVALFIVALYASGIPLYFAANQAACHLSEAACIEQGLPTSSMLQDLQRLGLSTQAWAAYRVALDVVSAGVWFAVGAIIFARKSAHAMALFIAFFLVTFGAGIASSGPLDALAAAHPAWWLPVQSVEFLGNACSALFAYLFPDGRFVPRWTRWLAVAWIALSVPVYFFPDTPFNYQNLPEAINLTVFIAFLSSFVGAQIIRYRRVSDLVQRQQTKWVVFGAAAAIIGFLGTILFAVFNPGLEQAIVPLMLANAAIYGSMLLIPLSFGVAILRSRLWDIDVIIRRTLIYSALSALLALLYFGSVVGLQNLFRAATGQSQSELVTVVSTLAIAVLFIPLRRRVQAFIDRRFYRRKYDAAKTLTAFSASVRDETDLEKLTERLVEVIDETLQPESVSLWLRPSERQPPTGGRR